VAPMSRPVGPYAPSRRAGDWVVTSGQIGVAPAPDGTMQLVDGGLEAQLAQALRNLTEVLAAQGATLADVVKATVFIVDMDQFALVNTVWVGAFGDRPPARSAVGVKALPLGAAVEIEALAFRPVG
jgi:2-iminobutanoate/2-iminopropanoate deaminase